MLQTDTLTRELFRATRPAFLAPVDEAYLIMFWRPCLGAAAYDLWRVLITYQQQIDAGRLDGWPGIKQLSETLATGDRYTITGRAATKTRPAQAGLLSTLATAGLVTYTVTGEGTRAARYSFDVRSSLPMLSPRQVQSLPPWTREQHADRVGRLPGNEASIWRGIAADTLIAWL